MLYCMLLAGAMERLLDGWKVHDKLLRLMLWLQNTFIG